MKSRLAVVVALACLVGVVAGTALADPVIPDYTFKLVGGKPGVIPGFNLNYSYHLGVTNPNPLDTGAGADHQYLAVTAKQSNYNERVLFYHRNDVTPYDDFQGKDSKVEQLNRSNNLSPQDDGRQASVEGVVKRVYAPIGRMTHEDYWMQPTGSSAGPYNEWQPRDASGTAATNPTYNQYLVYPDGSADADGLGVHHTTSSSEQWGASGYNKKGGTYVETLNPGTANEVIRGISYGTHWSTGQWGLGLYEIGPWTAPAPIPPKDPMQDLGSRSLISQGLLMTESDLDGLVPDPGTKDAFRSLFHDGQYLFFVTAGKGDNNVYLSAVEITDWANETWAQVDICSGPEMYQTFTFDSGATATNLFDTGGFVFASDPDNPGGPPLLYMDNGKNRIFVLEAPAEVPPIPEPSALALLGLGGLAALMRRRRRS